MQTDRAAWQPASQSHHSRQLFLKLQRCAATLHDRSRVLNEVINQYRPGTYRQHAHHHAQLLQRHMA